MKNKSIYKGAGICILTFILMILGTVNVEASETYYCDGCIPCVDSISRQYVSSWHDDCQEIVDQADYNEDGNLPYSCFYEGGCDKEKWQFGYICKRTGDFTSIKGTDELVYCPVCHGGGGYWLSESNVYKYHPELFTTVNGRKYGDPYTHYYCLGHQKYFVTYNANGGSGSMSSDSSTHTNRTVTLKSSGFTRDGYVFTGWRTEDGTIYQPGESKYVGSDITLYAQWELLDSTAPTIELNSVSWNTSTSTLKIDAKANDSGYGIMSFVLKDNGTVIDTWSNNNGGGYAPQVYRQPLYHKGMYYTSQIIDYSYVFDYNYYTSHYSDLAENGVTSFADVFEHFLNNGMKEHRQACASFNYDVYKANTGEDSEDSQVYEYYCYQMAHGGAEYCNGSADGALDKGGSSIPGLFDAVVCSSWLSSPQYTYIDTDGTDFTKVFNPAYYFKLYEDEFRGYSTDAKTLFSHFINNGRYELRQASSNFNPSYYKTVSRQDLVDVYGNAKKDQWAYYAHYMNYGITEGSYGTSVQHISYEVNLSSNLAGHNYTLEAVDLAGNVSTLDAVTSYTVKHYQEDLKGNTNTTPTDTETFYAEVGSKVTLKTKTYVGFKSPKEKPAVEVKSNGGTVESYEYTRNSYTVTLNKDDNISTVTGSGTYKYGATVTVKATPNSTTAQYSYSFDKWTKGTDTTSVCDSESYSFTMPASNVTLTANGTQTTRSYTQKVQVRYENADGTWGKYSVIDSATKDIEYGSTFTWGGIEATDVYEAADSVSYEVTEAHTTPVDIKRKTYNYEIHYLYQNINDDNYTEDTESLVKSSARYGASITGTLKTYEGFTTPASQSITIGTGTNEIKYYYTRNSYSYEIHFYT